MEQCSAHLRPLTAKVRQFFNKTRLRLTLCFRACIMYTGKQYLDRTRTANRRKAGLRGPETSVFLPDTTMKGALQAWDAL